MEPQETKLKNTGVFALGFGLGYFTATSKIVRTSKVVLLCVLSGLIGYFLATQQWISINF